MKKKLQNNITQKTTEKLPKKLYYFGKICFIFMLSLFFSQNIFSQTEDKIENKTENKTEDIKNKFEKIIIENINIQGNKRTKAWVILRELDIQKGDTIQAKNLDSLVKLNQQRIFNTQLFLDAKIHTITKENLVTIDIQLKERWYIFPIPIFELSDRNFSEWWNTYNHDFNRINYGIRLGWDNITGRKDELDLIIQSGFSQRFVISYKYPYLDKKRRIGLEMQASYIQNKTVAYRTQEHKLLFLKTNDVLRERFESRISVNYRKNFFTTHQFTAQYRQNAVNDTLLEYNPFYYAPEKNTQKNFNISYSGKYDYRDVQAYALKGLIISWNFNKNFGEYAKNIGVGFGVTKYLDLGKKWYSAHLLRVYYSDWFGYQPYTQAEALGYGQESLRGYDLYVIDGQSYFLQKNTLKLQIFDKKYKLFPKISALNNLPITVYLTAFTDFGFVKDDFFTQYNSTFNNTFLYSTGVGLDIITFYNMVLSFNLAQNKRQERGFFFNFNSIF